MTQQTVPRDILEKILAKSHEKLSAAERELAGEHYGEAASRAYYAVFHALSAVLASEGLSFSSHSQTLGGFNKHFVKEGIFEKTTTRKLQRLFEDRQVADYDWINTVDAETGKADVNDAKSIVDACEAYLNSRNPR